jgi:hypothetical protein
MSSYNLSSSHPIIPNSQQYMLHYKYISIHSDDRDIKKYQSSAEFEIELPQDYINVQTLKLNSWSFPSNIDIFTQKQNNLQFIFTVSPYYYNTVTATTNIAPSQTFTIEIEEGSYSSDEMAIELTNKMNQAVTEYIQALVPASNIYNDFVVIYHKVNSKLWFGNKNSSFTLNNGSKVYSDSLSLSNTDCLKRNQYTQSIYWGLPYYLGFDRNDVVSEQITNDNKCYYKENANWLSPTIAGRIPHIIKPDLKLNIRGPEYFYMEIAGLNNMDETMPFITKQPEDVIPCYYRNTNITNGIVNSCFAKIPLQENCCNHINSSYMLYNPPADKIRRLRIRLRFHDNSLVNFDNFEFSFVLQLGLIMPQNEKKFYVYVPEAVANSYN